MEIIKHKPQEQKIKTLIYGASGAWKTVFASSAPKPIFLSAESWLLSTRKELDVVMIKKLDDLRDAYTELKNKKDEYGYETIIIDSITEINDIIKAEIEKRNGRPMQIQDWWELAKTIKTLFKMFRDLDYHVLMIAQEDFEKDEERIHKIVPMLNGKSATQIAYYMDIVGYIYVEKDGTRKVLTDSDPKLLTKDRTWSIGNDTAPRFEAWVKVLEKMDTSTPLPKTSSVKDFLAKAKEWKNKA